MLNTKCDFCGCTDYELVYKPIGTKRDVSVAICKCCGLVFSIAQDIPYSREPNPSGDADWGNVRFCKGQRFDAVKDLLPIHDAKTILDVGSSRGHFVKWAREQNPTAEITAIEPDTRVIDDYAVEFGVIGKRLEDVDLPVNYFDFIYCMQTLEHSDSAAAMLKKMWALLAPGGVLFVEVPNIQVIDYPLNIEEFFIDKHNFHFSKESLMYYMQMIDYQILSLNDDNLNVRIFATKRTPQVKNPYLLADDSHNLISQYAMNIKRNRAKLPEIVVKLNRIMQSQKVAFWGGNVMLDLLIKYGGLDPKRVECLVDSYMAGLIKIHGIEIQAPEALRVYQPDVCIVLARHSADEVAKLARGFGIRNVIKFSDLIKG